MSAFLCSDNHINTLASWGAQHDASYCWNNSRISIKDDPAKIAALLYTANVESVNARYGEDDASVGFKYKRANLTGLTPVQILKACDCFDYQACEVKDYERTIAWAVINGIREAAIRNLPGYDDAAWGLY